MLHEFISANRDELIARARARVMERKLPRATALELQHGVPLFLSQVVELLRDAMIPGQDDSAQGVMKANAGTHGQNLLAGGLTVGQVVHDYGDICQVVTELAVERNVPIAASDFRTFNRCLDDAIAHAVTEYASARERTIAREETQRLGILAHELRNVIATAILSFDTIKRGVAGPSGSLGLLHTRSLLQLRDLVDRSLTEVRLDAEIIAREPVAIAEFIEDAEIAAAIQARTLNLELAVSPVERGVTVEIDRQVLGGALANLLGNAFKFTRPASVVSLSVRTTNLRVCIDVEDKCGGLPEGKAADLFRPFEQRGSDRSGLGLGLMIARRAVEANGGELRVLDLPHVGCRFTIDLPRFYPAAGAPR